MPLSEERTSFVLNAGFLFGGAAVTLDSLESIRYAIRFGAVIKSLQQRQFPTFCWSNEPESVQCTAGRFV